MTGLSHETDFAEIEKRALAHMLTDPESCDLYPYQRQMIKRLITNDEVMIERKEDGRKMVLAIDPAGGDHTAMLLAIVGSSPEFIIFDDFDVATDNALGRRWMPLEFGDQEITGTFEAEFKSEELLRKLMEPKKAQPPEVKPDNRKQRRIDAAKERRKPRGQRKRVILDIETYDPNRTKDWLN